jgi:RNA polymerase sigma-70 factor, ECF subfamily
MMSPPAFAPPTPAAAPIAAHHWAGLVERIRAGDNQAMEELYGVFSKSIRYFLYRQLGPQDLDDTIHDMFLIVTQAIQRGDLRDPDRLMGYVRTIVHRQVAAHIQDCVRARHKFTGLDGGMAFDRTPDPESISIEQQNHRLALRILRGIGARDREVLIRFYLREQSAADICRDLHMTGTQFRLIKSRAKARFGEMGRRRFSSRLPDSQPAAD